MAKTSGFSDREMGVAMVNLLMEMLVQSVKSGAMSEEDARATIAGAAQNARRSTNPINQAAGDFLEHAFLPGIKFPT